VTPQMFVGAAQHDVAVAMPALIDQILSTQRPDGVIPWWPGHKADPWDHVESTMGLTIGGAHEQARRAFEWLRTNQLPDGSWYAAYCDGQVTDRTRETNHAAYIAAGLYHYFLVTGDLDFTQRLWPTVDRAIDFVLRQQAASGEVYWAISPKGRLDRMALLTGCSSIFFSLRCALALASAMGRQRPAWRVALSDLHNCLLNKPHRFNTTKARFSMDWFYPVLCGAITGPAAQTRIDNHWKKFIIQNMGVRCVSDRPWVTIAETSELILALTAMGNHQQAEILFRWICDHTFDDGTFWCGFTVPDMVVWPEEKHTWTNAVVLMAADALYGLTPANRIFSHAYWHNQDL
jgi:hypothetical protein